MQSRQNLDRLHLDDDGMTYHKVETIAGVYFFVIVMNRQDHLSLNRKSAILQFMGKTMLVGRF